MAGRIDELMARLEEEADGCHAWSNAPGDVYGDHEHSYQKVLYCAAGSITFTLRDRDIHLEPGDRLVLEPGIVHGARVGPGGCTCVEGRGRSMASR